MDKHRTLLYTAAAFVVAVAAFLIFPRSSLLVRGIDALFISGLLFLLMGLFRFTRHLHMYDLLIYSTKKFAQVLKTKNYVKGDAVLGDYHEYVQNLSYNRPFAELLAVGGGFTALSVILLLFL